MRVIGQNVVPRLRQGTTYRKIIAAIIGTFGGTSAWNYYQKKMELKREAEADREKQTYLYRRRTFRLALLG